MTIKIHRILKDDLSKENSVDVVLSKLTETSSMTISNYAYSFKQTSATLPYEVEVVNEFVPCITNIDFAVSVRKRIDLTATGVNEEIITNVGNDVGASEYPNRVPHRPSDLPPGFTELYRG